MVAVTYCPGTQTQHFPCFYYESINGAPLPRWLGSTSVRVVRAKPPAVTHILL